MNQLPASPSPRSPRRPRCVRPALALLALVGLVLPGAGAAEESTAVLHVERSGVTTGPALLLIPGLSCGGDVWDGTVAALRGEFDLDVVTLAGFAGQPALELDEPFLPRVREALVAYMDEQELQRPALIGHSLGGFLAYWVASTYPERVGAVVAVDGVPFFSALQDASATPESMRPAAAQLRAMFAGMPVEQFRQQNELALRTMIRDSGEIARIAATSGRSDSATVGCAIEELMTTDLRPDLARITAPILQLGAFGAFPGAEQRASMVQRYTAQLAAAPVLPGARLVEAPTLHFVMQGEPEWFVAELREFLAVALASTTAEGKAAEVSR